jgi:hypothetical protein
MSLHDLKFTLHLGVDSYLFTVTLLPLLISGPERKVRATVVSDWCNALNWIPMPMCADGDYSVFGKLVDAGISSKFTIARSLLTTQRKVWLVCN